MQLSTHFSHGKLPEADAAGLGDGSVPAAAPEAVAGTADAGAGAGTPVLDGPAGDGVAAGCTGGAAPPPPPPPPAPPLPVLLPAAARKLCATASP